MGMYADVAGWLRLNDECLTRALEIIKADADGVGHYAASWCPQAKGGGYSRYLFYGCTVRESEVEEFRAQVARIAAEAWSADGDIKEYPEGLFRVQYETEGISVEVWHVAAGNLRVEKGA